MSAFAQFSPAFVKVVGLVFLSINFQFQFSYLQEIKVLVNLSR